LLTLPVCCLPAPQVTLVAKDGDTVHTSEAVVFLQELKDVTLQVIIATNTGPVQHHMSWGGGANRRQQACGLAMFAGQTHCLFAGRLTPSGCCCAAILAMTTP
jgi:hypothetical protein